MPEAAQLEDAGRLGRVGRVVSELRATDLRPGPVVDALFRELVALAVADGGEHPALADPEVLAGIRDVCARGEARLEAFWADRIAAGPGELARFPYLDNYRCLTAGEHGALTAVLGRPPRRLVFAGSGPLPLTAILLERLTPGLEITCLDSDPRALAQGEAVARAVSGGRTRLRFVPADAAAFDYADHDVALVAALVGLDDGAKRDVLHGVARTLVPGAVLAARSVPPDGRLLLYPRVERALLPRGVRVLGEWTPPPGVVNSLLLARVRSAGATP